MINYPETLKTGFSWELFQLPAKTGNGITALFDTTMDSFLDLRSEACKKVKYGFLLITRYYHRLNTHIIVKNSQLRLFCIVRDNKTSVLSQMMQWNWQPFYATLKRLVCDWLLIHLMTIGRSVRSRVKHCLNNLNNFKFLFCFFLKKTKLCAWKNVTENKPGRSTQSLVNATPQIYTKFSGGLQNEIQGHAMKSRGDIKTV